jgi:hypothetical protein
MLPLLGLFVINLVAAYLRTMPAVDSASIVDEVWPEFVLPVLPVDVRDALLAGGQWGARAVSETIAQQGQDNTASPALTEARVVRDYVRQQLLGIVYRGGWYVLFAPQGDDTLPLELQEGDTLPGSSWLISHILQDRLEIVDTAAADATPLIIPLYFTPDASTEP